MTPKVVITTNTLAVGGAEKQRIALARELAGRGMEVEIVVLQQAGALAGDLGTVPLHRVRPLIGRGLRADVVITGITNTEVALALRTRTRHPQTRWVVASHSAPLGTGRTYTKLLAMAADTAHRLVALTPRHARTLTSHDRFTIPISVIPNGVDTASLGSIERVGGASVTRLGFAGRLETVKGLDVLLRALRTTRGGAWTLQVFGRGSQEDWLKALSRESGLDERVFWRGWASPSDLFASIDVLIVPSRSEALPMVVLESMAAGVPVVASAVGGLPEVLGTGGGRVVPPTVAGLAGGVNDVLSWDEMDARAESERAQVVVREKYDVKHMADKYADLVAELTGRRRPRRDLAVVTAMSPTYAAPHFGIVVEREVMALQERGVSAEVLSKPPGWTGYGRMFVAAARLRREFVFSAVRVHYGTSGPAALVIPGRKVMSLHGSDVIGRGLKRITQRCISQLSGLGMDVVIVQEPSMGGRLGRAVGRKLVTLPQPVDLDRFRPGPHVQNFVLFLGRRAVPVKRFWLATAAMDLTRSQLELRALDHDPSNPAGLMASARLGLLTSEWEGSPVAVKEAIAVGLPVVSVDLPGVRRLQPLAPKTLTIVPGDARALADAIDAELARSRPARGTIERQRAALAAEGLSTDAFIEALSALLWPSASECR